MTDFPSNDSPRLLIDHFFRHEYGRIVAILARKFGIAHWEVIEDAVQTAMLKAIESWRHGPPCNASAWLYATSKNLVLDQLRRQSLHDQWVADRSEYPSRREGLHDSTDGSDAIGDESLRMLFLTCDPELNEESRVCLALKMVCGFRTSEIARGMLTAESAVQRRISRAKEKLQSLDRERDLYASAWNTERLESVVATIYLLFNEGYMVTSGEQLIRRELCEESIRLASMLAEHEMGQVPMVWALLALMEFHRSRFSTRVDHQGQPIPLDLQDRAKWDWGMIRRGMMWMERSAVGETLTRYHLESAIAWEHCRARRFEDTDWTKIRHLYSLLQKNLPSPGATFGYAIAIAYDSDAQAALDWLDHHENRSEYATTGLWHATRAFLFERQSKLADARESLVRAIELAECEFDRQCWRERLQFRLEWRSSWSLQNLVHEGR